MWNSITRLSLKGRFKPNFLSKTSPLISPWLTSFPFRLGNALWACSGWYAMPRGYDSFWNWFTLQRDFKWEESRRMKENQKIKWSQESWIDYDKSRTAHICIWSFLQESFHLYNFLAFILKTKHHPFPALISFPLFSLAFSGGRQRVQTRESVPL